MGDNLTETLRNFFDRDNPCLFAGAGLSARANLPTWGDFLDELASLAGRYDGDTSLIMRKRIEGKDFLRAADYYMLCDLIPKNIKFNIITTALLENEKYDINPLKYLVRLPFCCNITTNYDRVLHDSNDQLPIKIKKERRGDRAPFYVELDDASLEKAIYWPHFFIARVHGRAEIPDKIVLSSRSYEDLEKNQIYKDFLTNIFKNYSCLFLGYSFLDPAINSILDHLSKVLPQPFPANHLALLPKDVDTKLHKYLADRNIETVFYEGTNNHRELWEAIKYVANETTLESRHETITMEFVSGLNHFLASCYARVKMDEGKTQPLKEMITQGIIAEGIKQAKAEGITASDLCKNLKPFLSMDDDTLSEVVTSALDALSKKGFCKESQGKIFCQENSTVVYDSAMNTLVEGVVNRLKVRENVEADDSLIKSIDDILNRVFISRGWDLGAHFAGNQEAAAFEAWPKVYSYVKSCTDNMLNSREEAVASCIYELLRFPDEDEALLLSDMGRTAFGITLILKNPYSATDKSLLLPNSIYFDSNVLMPAILPSHPLHDVYKATIDRILQAKKRANSDVLLCVAVPFLNEIISHKKIAEKEIHDQGLQDPEKMKKTIIMFGAENTNVFVSAYAAVIGRLEKNITFRKYLSEYAPYGSIDSLASYLDERGFTIDSLVLKSGHESILNTKIFNTLLSSYENNYKKAKYFYKKQPVLVEHEALQITRIILDKEQNKNSLFVTADRQLISLCSGPVLGQASNNLVSNLGLVQIVDLVLGVGAASDGLNRLFWGLEYSNNKIMIKNYLINLALQHYDDAKAMAMHEVVDEIAEDAAFDAEEQKINFSPRTPESRQRSLAFMDRYEKKFYRKMSEVIKEREG
ncbi:MAG: SIR2 family protein [Desulfarculaceae bacterium]|nr:SIR2 family protein [Desulfarculaceae bacterium]